MVSSISSDSDSDSTASRDSQQAPAIPGCLPQESDNTEQTETNTTVPRTVAFADDLLPAGPSSTGSDNVRLSRDQELRNLSEALEKSIGDLNRSPYESNTQFRAKDRENVIASKSAQREAIEESMDQLVLRLSNDFTPLADQNWDTIVYIGSPARLPGQSQDEYDHVRKHFDRALRLDSRKIKQLGSAVFEILLRPNASIRAEKRLKKLGILNLDASAAKYHIDLRPPSEDEEAVILLTDLTCTQGVLTWHLAREKYGLSRTRVLGTDAFDTPSNPYYVITAPKVQLAAEPTEDGTDASDGESQGKTRFRSLKQHTQIIQPRLDIPPEYSPLRHHSAIERLLQAIAGNDPKLDSAPKLWTYFAISKYFDCAQNPLINAWILHWIYSGSNANFIQSNPETVYRIGMSIQSAEMVQDAFSILVGERALRNVAGETEGPVRRLTSSVHGRYLELLDDDEWNRVEHAASSLVRRIRALFSVFSVSMDWMMDVPEYAKLEGLVARTPEEQSQFDTLKQCVREYVRGKIFSVWCHDRSHAYTDLDQDARRTAAFRHGIAPNFAATYDKMNLQTRLFTRSFWMGLQRCEFQAGINNITDPDMVIDQGGRNMQSMINNYATDPSNGIRVINREVLEEHVLVVNRIILNREVQRQVKLATPRLPDQSPSKKRTSRSWFAFPPASPTPKRSSDINQETPATAEKRRKTIETGETRDVPLRLASHRADVVRGARELGFSDGINQQYHFPETSFEALHEKYQNKSNWTDDHSEGIAFADDRALQGVHTVNLSAVGGSDPASEGVAWKTEAFEPHSVDQPHGGLGGWDDRVYESQKRSPPNGSLSEAIVQQRWMGTAGSSLPHEQPQQHPILSKVKDFMVSRLAWQTGAPTEVEDQTTGADEFAPRESFESDLPILAAVGGFSPKYPRMPDVPSQMKEELPFDLDDIFTRTSGQLRPDLARSSQARVFGQEVGEESSLSTSKSILPSSVRPDGIQPAVWPASFYGNRKPQLPSAYQDETRQPYFSIHGILTELSRGFAKKCEETVYPPHLFHGDSRVPIDLVDSLTCLEDDEWKYLPLWAGGCDDGSGGVFDEVDVPNLEAGGFRGGKRGIGHGRHTAGDASVSGTDSSFDDIGSDAISTVGKASKAATDGTATVKSLSDTESETDFMNQDDIYEQIQQMKMEEAGKAQNNTVTPSIGVSGNGEEFTDGEEDGDMSTVVGAGSDIQGELFHDIDDDDSDKMEMSGDGPELSDDTDSEMEFINKEEL